MISYGYAATNLTLREEGVRTDRGMRKATFESRGVAHAGELAERNVRDLLRVVEWNAARDIYFYRITSNLFPWNSRYRLDDLPNVETVRDLLAAVGSAAERGHMRLTFHPNHYVKLGSPDESVVANSLTDLERHGDVMDAMGLSRTPRNPINVHVGAHYGDKDATARRFCENVGRLSESVRSRLTVENDDETSLWGVSELVELIHPEIGIPVVYDELHHQFTDRGLTFAEAAELAAETWDVTPIIHYSESRRLHEADPSIRPQNHSDYVAGPIRTYGTGADVMIEAKAKERALLRYREAVAPIRDEFRSRGRSP
jgi:UV DNA damage endonuclease